MKNKKFIQCGFEFTAALKLGGKITNKNLSRNCINPTEVEKEWGETISKVKWINQRYESDDCGCEIPTPILTSKEDLIRCFNQFKTFVKTNNFTLDINKAICGLGGCHIHLSMMDIPLNKRKLFLQNVGTFLTNNPQLNWGFNDVNDNYNANSLLNILSSFGTYVNPIKVFLRNPLKTGQNKLYAIRYAHNYRTLELRFFDMPKNLTQLSLHNDVAQAVFKYCLNKTKRDEKFELKYTKLHHYDFTLDESINKFNKAMKTLGIDTNRTKQMTKNIVTRYAWSKGVSVDDKKNYYLY